eukprot:CAMPEP_0171079338 /NCGR_PEP_ID=MMETSP0766_2-20121228/15196_1 /TAXON_ID=439317 /ORGANISM="Gambierdiscus australes, Strain CAWD 149" /LENGTH=44 /DNA_ID= /DNA_START= /DNA_END= /DNA_ORIENTATION=
MAWRMFSRRASQGSVRASPTRQMATGGKATPRACDCTSALAFHA